MLLSPTASGGGGGGGGGFLRRCSETAKQFEEQQQIERGEEEEEEEQERRKKRQRAAAAAAKSSSYSNLTEKDATAIQLAGIPLQLSQAAVKSESESGGGVIFVLEKASLSLAFVGKRYQILNPDEHASFMRRKNINPYDHRPDIVHEALLDIMDSRFRQSGRLKAVYIRTDKGVLIKVEPNTQIPRTLESFCHMMSELLQKFSIKAKGGHGKLLRLIENPVTKYLPVNSRKIGLSFHSEKPVDIRDYISEISNGEDLVFVVGAMAHGNIDCDFLDDLISVSGYPLSAGLCVRHILNAMERKWKIR